MRAGLLTLVVVWLFLLVSPAAAKPYVLKCSTADGHPAADLTVDLENRVMEWGGVSHYVISSTTERYITAVKSPDDFYQRVGGETWVLDRVTGDYKRANVAMFCQDDGCQGGMVLRAFTYSGRCVRPIL